METNEPSNAPLTDHEAHQPSTQESSEQEQQQSCVSSSPEKNSSFEEKIVSSDGQKPSRDAEVLSSEKKLSAKDEKRIHALRQKRMGPAPFASFEDLSDEVRARLESPDDKISGVVLRLPGIREDVTPTTPGHRDSPHHQQVASKIEIKSETRLEDIDMAQHSGISVIGAIAADDLWSSFYWPQPTRLEVNPSTPALQSTSKMSIQPPTTPRIDISRASSSSHHDSKDSTPEREIFEGGGEGQSAKLGLGFKEDGAMDLRASTEELDFHDPEEVKKSRSRATSPSPGPEENYRKDSQCSDIVLLSISGRTSRLSSIGSQGSGQSRLSNASHLSVLSGHSNLSRCSSPHKMLLETSFCGYKSPDTQSLASETGTNIEDEEIERLLLSRKHDPTQALLAEGMKVENKTKTTLDKPTRKGSDALRNDIQIKVDKPGESGAGRPKMPRKIISKSGVEYIYIPLKGPMPKDDSEPEISSRVSRSAPATMTKTRTTTTTSTSRSSKSASQVSKSSNKSKSKNQGKSSSHSRSNSHSKTSKNVTLVKNEVSKPVTTTSLRKDEEPKYIRIKLKPDHCYSDEDQHLNSKLSMQNIIKPDSLDLNLPSQDKLSLAESTVSHEKKTPKFEETLAKNLSSTPSLSPKPNKHKVDHIEPELKNVTPSPSVSRRSSFTSLFKSKEALSPLDSPTVQGHRKKSSISGILKPSERDRSRSRSKSKDRDSQSAAVSSSESIDSKNKQKSILSIFKTSKKDKKSDSDVSSQETIHSVETLGQLEFKFNEPTKSKREKPLEGDSIRIPLHSPTYYETEHKLEDWKNSSQDSQETVIEASTRRNVNVVIEADPLKVETTETQATTTNKKPTSRQNSTDSQSVVFSTKLGAENEVFSIKLPKQKVVTQPISTIEKSKPSAQAQISLECETDVRSKKVDVDDKMEINKTEKTTTLKTKEESLEKHYVNKYLDSSKSENINKSTNEQTENKKTNRESLLSVLSNKSLNLDEDRNNSSESERDSEMDYPRVKRELEMKSEHDPDREAIVLQQDSFEDELPYVPTTLPQERSAAVPIVPIKQRATLEMKTCPIERPRSTTPTHKYIISSELEGLDTEKSDNVEKLKISLPRHDSVHHKRTKSAEVSTNVTQIAQSPKSSSHVQTSQTSTSTEQGPPPLPPKGVQKTWVNFEDIPEKRKPPKRIQTIPSRGHIEVPDVVLRENVVYTYVDPEECKCECHEQSAKERDRRKPESAQESAVQEDELPLLEDDLDERDENKSISNAIHKNGEHKKRDVCRKSESAVSNGVKKEPSLRTSQCSSDTLRSSQCSSDVTISSNRSSIKSQDDPQSPNNAFPKNS